MILCFIFGVFVHCIYIKKGVYLYQQINRVFYGGKTMQNFNDFLNENYEISKEEYENLDTYKKNIIDREYEAYTNCYIK